MIRMSKLFMLNLHLIERPSAEAQQVHTSFQTEKSLR